jgi:hypothetical protein
VFSEPNANAIWSIFNTSNDTHQAVLINIEKITKKECEHEVLEISGHTEEGFYMQPKRVLNNFHGWKCRLCGVALKPVKWEAE